MKKNFLLNTEHYEIINSLSNEDAGELLKGIFNYVSNGESNLDGYLKTIFIPFKQFIDKNEETYQKICERNKENGLRGGRPKKEETQNNPLGFLETQRNPEKPDIYHNHSHISSIINHNSKEDRDRGMGEEEETKYKQEFEELWSIYPNKKGKTTAIKKYSLARKQGTTYEEVRQGLESYIDYCKIENIETKYIKHASTWFNQKCWNDDYTITRVPTTKDIAKVIDWKEYNEKYGN